MDLSLLFGGPQGSGVQSASDLLAKTLVRAGYHVFVEVAYASNIHGAHQYARLRVSDRPVRASREQAELVVALDLETLVGDARLRTWPGHRGHVHQATSVVVHDAALGMDWTRELRDPVRAQLVAVAYDDVVAAAQRDLGQEPRPMPILRNTAALGAAVGLLRLPVDLAVAVVREQFATRRGSLADLNERVLRAAAQVGESATRADLPHVTPIEGASARILLRGTQASALGKLAAGCALQTYYPIAPATDESTYLERAAAEHNVVVVQCEDEAASACMLVGAAHAGVRASTATSGPGFALMCEAIGVAAEMEAPGMVITLYQRSGPSTGMPTRYEQADLLWSLHPAQGEFPHIVIAPADATELYLDTYRAFNWAERWGLPIIVLTDKHVGGSGLTLDGLPALPEPIDRGAIVSAVAPGMKYLRYAGTEGASPRTLPGTPGGIFWTTSDEHDPDGHITEGVAMRTLQMHKRMSKLDLVLRGIADDVTVAVHGPGDAAHTVVFWGATKGVVLDVLALRQRTGRVPFRAVQVRLMRPFPAAALARALDDRDVTVVEENHTGQLEELMRANGASADGWIRKADGRPLKLEELDAALERAFQGERAVRVVSDD